MSLFSQTIEVFIVDIVTGNKWEIPYETINYIKELNNGSTAKIDFDFNAVKAICATYNTTPQDLFTSSLREVQIFVEGTLIWLGVVSEYQRTKDATGTYTGSFAAVDYFALFQKRRTGFTEVDFIGVDPATIPWSLINTSQLMTNGNLGITLGVTASTGLTITAIYKDAEVRQEIVNLSNYKTQGSFDFDIDLTRKFNVYFPTKGSVRSNIVLDDNNILSDTVKIPVVLSLANSVFVHGQGTAADQANVNRTAPAYQVTYKLLEDVVSNPNVSDLNILNGIGDKFLALNESPLYQISLNITGDDPDITTYDVGDTLVVNIPEEGVNYANYRVKKQTVNIDKGGQILVQLDMLII